MSHPSHRTGRNLTAEQRAEEARRLARRVLAIEERRRRLEIIDRQHAARKAEQDRRLEAALGESRR